MSIQFKVPSMACSACVDTITQAVKQVDDSAAIAADPKTKVVQVETQASEATVKQAIEAAGYPVG
uniref:heavy-metal-associated domain-containing protein n=1 Tax=Trichocoleus desertorum TaxID=1481672 RepID=UPI0025B447C5|nr:heavy-metal-associated domain-containing protein [Trichocoleus desertorum]